MFHKPLRNGEFTVAVFLNVYRCYTAVVSEVVSNSPQTATVLSSLLYCVLYRITPPA
jgi:hypothetical protein